MTQMTAEQYADSQVPNVDVEERQDECVTYCQCVNPCRASLWRDAFEEYKKFPHNTDLYLNTNNEQ